MEQKKPQFQLVDLTQEEAKIVKKEIEDLLAKHSIQFLLVPFINGDGRISAKMDVLKKVELVPKGVPSPLMENGKFIGEDEGEADKKA